MKKLQLELTAVNGFRLSEHAPLDGKGLPAFIIVLSCQAKGKHDPVELNLPLMRVKTFIRALKAGILAVHWNGGTLVTLPSDDTRRDSLRRSLRDCRAVAALYRSNPAWHDAASRHDVIGQDVARLCDTPVEAISLYTLCIGVRPLKPGAWRFSHGICPVCKSPITLISGRAVVHTALNTNERCTGSGRRVEDFANKQGVRPCS